MQDTSLRQDIIDELEFEPSIDAAHIGVAVESGVVTLTGHVSTYAEKMKIESVVMRVKGVKGIAEEIEVRVAGANRTADDEIAKRAVNMLKWTTAIPEDSVKVKVQNGWVTLTGSLDWHYQKRAASESVENLSGVTGVSNQIEIKPRATASDVKKRIESALKRDAEIDASAIRVNVLDSKVTLEGRVNAWSDRQIAERAAWSVPGVVFVDDRITVS
jgi:osmotically-inducible protein OsmY